jgi:hypothetical protein
MNEETIFQQRLDLVLGVLYSGITVFAFSRCYSSWKTLGGRKVVSVFNTLIFLAAFLRAIWFLIPNNVLEPTYEPLPERMKGYQEEKYSLGILISEMLQEAGSFFFYAVFVLIGCYWFVMLQKLDSHTSSELPDGTTTTPSTTTIPYNNPSSSSSSSNHTDALRLLTPSANTQDFFRTIGPLGLFLWLLLFMFLIPCINIICFLNNLFTTEQMIQYDAITFATLAIGIVSSITYLSRRINRVLKNMEIIKQSSSKSQIQRIRLIVFLAIFFFCTRILLELFIFMWLRKQQNSNEKSKFFF